MAAKPKTAYETVTMLNGDVVDFPGKRKLQKTSTVTPDGASVRLDFRNGETRHFTIPASLMTQFAAHGAEQKLGDAIAGLDDLDDCVLAIDELMDRLNAGEWGAQRESNGLAGTSVLVRALVEQTGKTLEAIKAFLSGKTQAEKVALRNNPRIRPIVERIEAEKVSKASTVDTDALLEELA